MAKVIAVVGAGGKTTLIRKLAEAYHGQGRNVFVTTSVHMYREADTLVTDCAEEIIKILDKDGYVMAGRICEKEPEKICGLSETTYRQVCSKADIVLIEADGSKHRPLKVPAVYEPVIYDNVNEIIVVCGLHALGKKAGAVIHRFDLARKLYDIEEDTEIQTEHIYALVRLGYLEPLKNKYPGKQIQIYISHDDSQNQRKTAQKLNQMWNEKAASLI